jgi:hypothetical protein
MQATSISASPSTSELEVTFKTTTGSKLKDGKRSEHDDVVGELEHSETAFPRSYSRFSNVKFAVT